ncbi:hypothetical protein [Sinosporangium siamense]|uniref:Uncharacterized protein n=1 Tax=Sinosporangium siamense TaxID=1367973 RepID=A0A919RL67_9ACTN|nr:hypothetical protein [Sinosporangium siamense]GII95232.1 hypothetical protein Ssi02_54630 [Sinosporangium siamense]
MFRRALATTAAAALTAIATLTVATPAQAEVDMVASPLYLGDYCRSQVHSSAGIGFYYGGSVECHSFASGGGLAYVGSGSPWSACAWYRTPPVIRIRTVVGGALGCTYAY